MTKFPDELIALVRAACFAKVGHKVIAKHAGISIALVEKISQGERSPDIQPHPDFDRRMKALFISSLSDDTGAKAA